MRFAAGEILHSRAERIGGKKANIDLHAAAHAKADFVFTACDDVHQARQLDDVIDEFLALLILDARLASYENIEITHGFASAAERPGWRDLFYSRVIAQVFDDFSGLRLRRVDEKASGDAAIILDRLEQLLLMLFSHARQDANLAFLGQLFHAFRIADLVGAPDQGDGFGTEALNLQQVKHRWMIFIQQIGMQRQLALAKHFLKVGQHSFADAGDREDLLGLADQFGYLLGEGFNSFGGVAVGADAKGVLAVDLKHGGGFIQNSGDGFIVHVETRLQSLEQMSRG